MNLFRFFSQIFMTHPSYWLECDLHCTEVPGSNPGSQERFVWSSGDARVANDDLETSGEWHIRLDEFGPRGCPSCKRTRVKFTIYISTFRCGVPSMSNTVWKPCVCSYLVFTFWFHFMIGMWAPFLLRVDPVSVWVHVRYGVTDYVHNL